MIGHELSHVRNYDIRFALLVGVLVGGVALLSDFFLRYHVLVRRRPAVAAQRQRGGGGGLQVDHLRRRDRPGHPRPDRRRGSSSSP